MNFRRPVTLTVGSCIRLIGENWRLELRCWMADMPKVPNSSEDDLSRRDLREFILLIRQTYELERRTNRVTYTASTELTYAIIMICEWMRALFELLCAYTSLRAYSAPHISD